MGISNNVEMGMDYTGNTQTILSFLISILAWDEINTIKFYAGAF